MSADQSGRGLSLEDGCGDCTPEGNQPCRHSCLVERGGRLMGRTPSPDDVLIEAIAERRKDKAFMARLAARIEADAPLLLRLSGHSECQTARLVESRNGGALLVYECECGAKLIRTKDDAERGAL